jgi:sugar diacid utilization regulator
MNRNFDQFVTKATSLIKKFGSADFYQWAFSLLVEQITCINAIMLYLYDDKKNLLQVEHAFGFERNVRGIHSFNTSEGICGKVFSSGKGELILDQYQLKSFAQNIEELVDIVHFDDGNISPVPSSLIAVPIMLENTPVGVLVIMDFSSQHLLTLRHLNYAENVTKIIALHRHFENINMENYDLHEELSLIKNVLERDGDMLLYAGVVSSAFSSIFLKGQEFDEMLKQAYSYTSFPMVLYNIFLEKMSCTDDTYDIELPENTIDMIQPHGLLKKEWRCVTQRGKCLYLLPVQYGGTIRGILAVCSPHSQLSIKERVVLETLSFYLSFVWLKKAAVNERNKSLKSELLTGILSGKKDDTLLTKAKILGLTKNGKFFVILLAVPDVDNHLDYCEKQEGAELLHTLEDIMKARTRGIIIVPEYNDICIIASCNAENCSNKRYANIVANVIEAITKARPDITVSGSRVYETIYNVRKCYWEANQCLTIIHKYFIHRKSFNYLDMGALRLLLTQRREDIEAYMEDILRPIIEYDKNRGTDLIMTLFYYSRFNKSVSYVSKKLNIHTNTLYQRVKKIEELLGYSLDDPMDWFDIQAASIMYGLIYTDLITKL